MRVGGESCAGWDCLFVRTILRATSNHIFCREQGRMLL